MEKYLFYFTYTSQQRMPKNLDIQILLARSRICVLSLKNQNHQVSGSLEVWCRLLFFSKMPHLGHKLYVHMCSHPFIKYIDISSTNGTTCFRMNAASLMQFFGIAEIVHIFNLQSPIRILGLQDERKVY